MNPTPVLPVSNHRMPVLRKKILLNSFINPGASSPAVPSGATLSLRCVHDTVVPCSRPRGTVHDGCHNALGGTVMESTWVRIPGASQGAEPTLLVDATSSGVIQSKI